MKKVILIILAVVFILTGCRSETSKRMRCIESGWTYDIYLDTNTGICYLKSGSDYVVMVDHDGMPYVENGWRDYD